MLPLEIQIDAMTNLRSNLVTMRESVKTGEFKDVGGPLAEFGAFDKSGMLRHHHSLAHGLMLETLKAVAESIDVFYNALAQAQNAFDEADQRTADDLSTYRNAVAQLNEASYLPGTDEARDRYRDNHGRG